jgi:NitT/TauT family transport system ATP-binding protein
MLSDRIGVMSARPGRFIETLATGWPRERDSQVVNEPHFGELTAQMWTHLRAESLRSIGT